MSVRSGFTLGGTGKFFAVHPLALTFARDYSKNMVLYFQKDLKILSRVEITERMAVKDEKYYFQIPSNLQSFRVNEQKELDFKWSIYVQRITDNYQHEEYMQSKKANLKWTWDVYDRYQKSANSVEVNFGMIKVRYTYIFILADTHNDILEAIRNYYEENKITPTDRESPKKAPPAFSYRRNATLPELPNEDEFIEYSQISQNNIRQTSNELRNPRSGGKANWNVNSFLKISEGRHSPEALSKIDIQDLGATQRSGEGMKLKRTFSEVEGINDFERMAMDNEEMIKKTAVNIFNFQDTTLKKLGKRSQYGKKKWITQSIYLDQNGQLVVLPFYTQFKYWLIILAIVIIFIGLMYQGPKARSVQTRQSHHKQPHSTTHKKQQQQKGQPKSSARKPKKTNRK